MASSVAEKVPGWVGRILIPEIKRVVEKEVESLRCEMSAKFEAIDRKFEAIDSRFVAMDAKFEAIDTRFEAIDTKFEAVNARLDAIEKRFDLVRDVAVLKAQVKEIQEKTGAT